jgi:hypothetical protein
VDKPRDEQVLASIARIERNFNHFLSACYFIEILKIGEQGHNCRVTGSCGMGSVRRNNWNRNECFISDECVDSACNRSPDRLCPSIFLLFQEVQVYGPPIQTALIFLAVIFFMDFFVVALAIMRSVEMFSNALGTWIPFALIFLSTYLTGLYVTRGREET